MSQTCMKHKYFLPAEWHQQWGVQLTWPHADTDWQPYLDDISAMFVAMAKAISQYEHLVVATPNPMEVEQQLRQALTDSQWRNVRIYECNSNDTWARDHAPITLLSTTDGSPLMLDFKFNGWGEKFAADKDNAISANLRASGALPFDMADNQDFVLEGGAIESDGKGTIFTTSQCLLAPHRNQPLDRLGIERQLLDRLHADRVVWLDHGNLIGDDTDGHIDTIVRIAPNDTLLYMGCDDATDEQYADLKALESQLMELRTIDDKPYRLLKLPSPKAIYDDGDRLPATYANFLVINGAVICPTYRQPDADAQAMNIIQQAFPDRVMIAVDATTAIRQHGSIHCLTMQYPK